jgi:hypothetical protein
MKRFFSKLRSDQIFFIYILLFSFGFFFGGFAPKYVLNKLFGIQKNISKTNASTQSSNTTNSLSESSQSGESFIESTPTLTPSKTGKGVSVSSSFIAYIEDGEVWVGDTTAWNPQEITSDEYDKFMISISPDKTKIVYAFYPDNPKRRTNFGALEGFHSGIGVVSLVDGQSKIIVPYGDKLQHQYPQFSNDSRFISIWSGNGRSSEIYDTSNGKLVKRFESEDYIPVSPISFIPKQSRISMVKNNKLVVSNIDGSGEYIISQNAEPLRSIHEGQIIPIVSLWSADGRYVTFQDTGDLKVYDTSKKLESTIVTGIDNAIVGGRAPQGFASSFSSDSKKLLLQDVRNTVDVEEITIDASVSASIGSWGNSMLVSPDTSKTGGTNYLGQFESYVLSTGETKTCEDSVYYPYFAITAGKAYQNGVNYFSSDGKKILVQKSDNQGNGLYSLHTDSCELIELISTSVPIIEFTWFP